MCVRSQFVPGRSYCSLHQQPSADTPRSPHEEALYGMATRSMAEWLAHSHSVAVLLREMPPDYPLGFSFQRLSEANHAAYDERGWVGAARSTRARATQAKRMDQRRCRSV